MATRGEEIVVPVEGMTCGGCAAGVKRALERLDGVLSVDVQLADKQARVRYDGQELELGDLARAVEDAGFTVPAEWLATRPA